MRPPLLLLLLSLLLLLGCGLGLALGSLSLSPGELWQALRAGDTTSTAQAVVMELRLPRIAAAIAVGAMLALAGALMQVLLGNPLADPYVLGISGGAATGALLALVLGLGSLAVDAGALAGALLSIALVFGLARRRGDWSATRLLLTGVVIAAGWGALISFLLAIAPDENLRGMLFWLMGDLADARLPLPALLLLPLLLLLLLPLGRSLNLMARGEQQAALLGVETRTLRLQLYLLASLLTALAVTLGGSIGFVGLVVPHMLRLVIGSDHRLLLPASALLGATLLVVADTLARTLWAPQQLPVGILTALLGVPLFLYLLQRSASR